MIFELKFQKSHHADKKNLTLLCTTTFESITSSRRALGYELF